MRIFYVVLSYLLTPFVVLFLLWRGLRNPAYFERFGERFGFSGPRVERRSIWIHAVSVGEVQAAVPLINALLERYPATPVVVTTVTPTGAQRVDDIFRGRVIHGYAPYDLPGAVSRFFRRVQPVLAIIMETELWPNLYSACGKRGVPLVLASARVSPRSVASYRRFVGLFRETLSHGIVIAAQSEADEERFLSLGADPARTRVTGNIKFDIELPDSVASSGRAFRAEHAPSRAVWIAASTHVGEEEQVLNALPAVREAVPGSLLIIAPRHPERFEQVAELVRQAGFDVVTRRSGGRCSERTDVFVLDTLGELPAFYAASDVAFVGGSLVPIGGHNLLEPAALGVPILTGPHYFNAEDIAATLSAAGALGFVRDEAELAAAVYGLLQDPVLRAERAQNGLRAVRENRGALSRVLALITPLIDGKTT